MGTIDDDWQCDNDASGTLGCFAVWQDCDRCMATVIPPEIQKIGLEAGVGLVPVGEGLCVHEQPGNLWYASRDVIGGRFDICPTCTGSGGGYCCGLCDLQLW